MNELVIITISVIVSVLMILLLLYYVLQRSQHVVTEEKLVVEEKPEEVLRKPKLALDPVAMNMGTVLSPATPTPMEFFNTDVMPYPIRPRIRDPVSRASMTSTFDDFGEIDPTMYELENIDDNSEEPVKLGEIQFSLLYDSFRNILRVTLLAATDLAKPEVAEFKHLNPYVTITLQPEYRHLLQSKVQQKTKSPIFNEKFEFEVLLSNLYSQTLCFNVFNFLTGSRHSVIGQASLPLADLRESVEQTFTLALQPTNESMKLGDILFSLGYLRIAGRLTLIVIKARNLPQASVKGTDAYVKVTLIQNGRRTKKKKTSTKKNQVNPVYNEAVSFDIASESLETTDILLTVIHENKIIGCVLVGGNTYGKGLDHWKRMKISDKPIAEWHALQDGRKFY